MRCIRKIIVAVGFFSVFFAVIAEIPGSTEKKVRDARTQQKLAETNYYDGYYISALSRYKSAYLSYMQAKEFDQASDILLTLSDIYLEMGKPDSCRMFFNRAENLIHQQQIDDPVTHVKLTLVKAGIFISLSEFEKYAGFY